MTRERRSTRRNQNERDRRRRQRSGRDREERQRGRRYQNTRSVGYERGAAWKSVLLTAIIAIVVLLAVTAGGIYLLFRMNFYGKSNYVKNTGYTVSKSIQAETYIDEEGNVKTVEEAKLSQTQEEDVIARQEQALKNLKTKIDEDSGTYNLLLIGVDRRDSSWNGNSDVMMLVTVNHDRKTIYMTSFLRDLYANIPEVGVRKLNASCAYGGAELCVETIKRNYGVEIDNYAMVDFNAMIDIVDALGGIDLDLTDEEVEVANAYARGMCIENGEPEENHVLYPSEMEHLDGYLAVAYARNRYTGNTYDFGRTERQRKVLTAIFEKAKNGGLGSLNTAAQSVLPYVTHDIDEVSVMRLIAQLPGWLKYDIQEQHIPYDNMYDIENEILIPDM